MVILLPWLNLESEIQLDSTVLAPLFVAEGELHVQLRPWKLGIRRLLSAFIDLDGRSIRSGAFAYNQGSGLDMSEGEAHDTRQLSEVAFLASFARNDYLTHGSYINAAAFQVYETGFASALEVRVDRLDRSYPSIGEPGRHIRFHQPAQTRFCSSLQIDSGLTRALLAARAASSRAWTKLTSALRFFRQATLDEPTMPIDTKLILMVTAYERLLDNRARESACLLAERLRPYRGSGSVSEVRSRSSLLDKEMSKRNPHLHADDPLHKAWLFELYELRGKFLHAHELTGLRLAWTPAEHLLMAAYVFTLLVRMLLAEEGYYKLTTSDQADVLAVDEHLASFELRGQWLQSKRNAMVKWTLASN